MPEYFKRDPAGVPQEITNRIAKRMLERNEQSDGHTTPWGLHQLGAFGVSDPAGDSGDTGGEVPVLSDEWLGDMRREYKEEDSPPAHVIRAMSKIAIYAATHGGQSYMYLHDPVVYAPIGVVQEWLKEYGYEFDD